MKSVCFIAILATVAVGIQSAAAVTITQQYDFETGSSPSVTQPGWTSIQYDDPPTPTSGGFVLTNTNFTAGNNHIFTGTITPAQEAIGGPADVIRETLYQSAGPNTAPSGVGSDIGDPGADFQDIIPASVDFATYTIYRSDLVDGFNALFQTYIQINGGTPVLVHPGSAGGTVVPPIVGTIPVPNSATTGTIDFLFYDLDGGSELRLNGIQIVYTPEPASAVLLTLGGLSIARRRTR